MFKVEIDANDAGRLAQSFGASIEQIPYALSLAMNRSADVTRDLLIKHTWPGHVQVRNNSFIAASLTTRGARAQKGSLSVEIYDKLDRGHLKMHAYGGVRTPKGGGNLAIPVSSIPKGAKGVPQRLRPRNLKDSFKKNGMLYQKTKKGRLKLVYSLRATAKLPKRVPFEADFVASMSREMKRTIPLAVQKAMATAKRK